MIEPWQVWMVNLGTEQQQNNRLAVVISADFHLRINVGRSATVAPLINTDYDLAYHVPVKNPNQDATHFVCTDQMRTLWTSRFLRAEPLWTLDASEISRVADASRFMLDI